MGEVYVENSSNKGGWFNITNFEGEVAWNADGKGGNNEGWATIYYYPNNDNMNRRSAALRIRGSVKDSQNDLVDFVASDVHHDRENFMLKAKTFVEKKYGKDRANKLFIENAKKLIEG